MTTTPVEGMNAASAPGAAIPFPVASRPQRRFSNTQTVNNTTAGSLQPIPLPATGWVRRVSAFFTTTQTFASGAAVVAGDGPFRAIQGITLTDATGQPVYQPLSGYNTYLVNKFFGTHQGSNLSLPWQNPISSPEYQYLATGGVSVTATYRLDLDFEQDANTGYGCIPNLDSNASLQLKIDYNASSAFFTGTTPGAASMTVRISQEYWAPVASSQGGLPVDVAPPGAGDFVETRYETQAVSASAENLLTLTNRGGMIKGIILVSRAAGVRTAVTPATNFGILLDNQPINEGVPIEEHYDYHRRQYGYFGADRATSYGSATAGVQEGLDVGVVPINFDGLSGGRMSWLNTRAGSLLQLKFTPGAGATQVEVITVMAQVKDKAAFYGAR